MIDTLTGEGMIRSYRASDRVACFDICVRTADAGGDARGQYSTDDLMPAIFFAPYVDLDSDLAFVVEIDGEVVGYVVATANTREFVDRYRAQLLPAFAREYPFADPQSSREAFMVGLGHTPERLLLPQIDEYAAHLHIDLLPGAQGRGWGRRLIDSERAALAARGVLALHLTMVTANARARAFYTRLGFVLLDGDGTVVTLGIATR